MKTVTLSFDNGPDPTVTPRVLDILRDRGILTSFFVVGERLRDPARRAACERARAEGHRIGNHSHNHLQPLGTTQSAAFTLHEIRAAEARIGDLAETPPLYRPAGALGALDGSLLNRVALDHLAGQGYTCVLWNAIPRDWERPATWVETALDQCAALDRPLLVLHDIDTGAMDQLERFLDRLHEADCEVVQDYPPDCLPIVAGRIMYPMDRYVAV